MRSLRTAAIVLLALSICACGDGHGGGHAHEAKPHADESPSPQPGGTGSDLQLNGTQKWRMDDHTRKMFATMVARLEGRSAEELASRQLGRELDEDLDSLVQGCTMTGDAHRELHKYLGAYIPAVQALATEGDEGSVREVQRLLELYPRYFE